MNLLRKILLLLVPITLSNCGCLLPASELNLFEVVQCTDVTLDGRTPIKSLLNNNDAQKARIASHIYVVNSSVPVIEKEIFDSFFLSAKVTFDNDGVIDIQPQAFSGIYVLKYLTITNNPLTSIRSDALSNITRLTFLDLSHNKLANLENIYQLSSLVTLNVSNNQIMIVSGPDFQKLEALNTLDLSGNLLQNVDSKIFKTMKNLIDLNLSNNSLNSFVIRKFQHPIVNLVVSQNNLERIEIEETESIEIYSLDLSSNFITVLNYKQFENLHKISSLLLNSNSIKEIDADAFVGLNNLTSLSLENNDISKIYVGTFHPLMALQNLNLSRNQIETLDSGIFTGLNSLLILDLSENRLHSINSHNLYSLRNLQTFYLHGNPLGHFDTYTFTRNLKSLKHLSINFKNVGCAYVGSMVKSFKNSDINIQKGHHLKSHNIHGIGCDPDIKDIDHHRHNDSEDELFSIISYFPVIQAFLIILVTISIIFLIIKALAFYNIDFDYCRKRLFNKETSANMRFSENDHD